MPPHELPGRQLHSKEAIRKRVHAIGVSLQNEHAGKELTIVCVLTGSVVFTADLIRHLETVTLHLEMVRARRRGAEGEDGIDIDCSFLDPEKITERDVLIVDDIISSGQTLRRIVETVRAHSPKRLRAAVLLKKRGRQRPDFNVTLAHVGFEIPDSFVVGYGMDRDGKFRNLRCICAVP
jgi:hypoxanthine phosphoribosyltransferase